MCAPAGACAPLQSADARCVQRPMHGACSGSGGNPVVGAPREGVPRACHGRGRMGKGLQKSLCTCLMFNGQGTPRACASTACCTLLRWPTGDNASLVSYDRHQQSTCLQECSARNIAWLHRCSRLCVTTWRRARRRSGNQRRFWELTAKGHSRPPLARSRPPHPSCAALAQTQGLACGRKRKRPFPASAAPAGQASRIHLYVQSCTSHEGRCTVASEVAGIRWKGPENGRNCPEPGACKSPPT